MIARRPRLGDDFHLITENAALNARGNLWKRTSPETKWYRIKDVDLPKHHALREKMEARWLKLGLDREWPTERHVVKHRIMKDTAVIEDQSIPKIERKQKKLAEYDEYVPPVSYLERIAKFQHKQLESTCECCDGPVPPKSGPSQDLLPVMVYSAKDTKSVLKALERIGICDEWQKYLNVDQDSESEDLSRAMSSLVVSKKSVSDRLKLLFPGMDISDLVRIPEVHAAIQNITGLPHRKACLL